MVVKQLTLPRPDETLAEIRRQRRAMSVFLEMSAHSDTPSRVINLRTGEVRLYTVRPLDAVLCAYAQERRDYFTPLYRYRYDRELHVGFWHVFAGDWGCRLQ